MNKLILSAALLLLSSQAFAVTCLEVTQAERTLAILEKNIAYFKALPPGPNDHLISPQDKFRNEARRVVKDSEDAATIQKLKDIIEHKSICTQ